MDRNGTQPPQLPPHFDPFNQPVPLTLPNGATVPIPMVAVEYYRQYSIRTSLNYGTQIGATIITLLVFLMLTPPVKYRQSPVMALNLLALVLNLIRTILQSLFFTSSAYAFYAALTGDFSRVPASTTATSCTVPVLVLVLTATILASLMLQLHTVSITASRASRLSLVALALSISLVALALKFAQTVLIIQRTRAARSTQDLIWLAQAVNASACAAIAIFSAVFVGKLVVALRRRRRLGLRQFGPMQVVVIMGAQTMLLPVLFYALEFLPSSPELATMSLTITALCMPLSSIWAAATLDGNVSKASSSSFSSRFSSGNPNDGGGKKKKKMEKKGQGAGWWHQCGSGKRLLLGGGGGGGSVCAPDGALGRSFATTTNTTTTTGRSTSRFETAVGSGGDLEGADADAIANVLEMKAEGRGPRGGRGGGGEEDEANSSSRVIKMEVSAGDGGGEAARKSLASLEEKGVL